MRPGFFVDAPAVSSNEALFRGVTTAWDLDEMTDISPETYKLRVAQAAHQAGLKESSRLFTPLSRWV